MAVKLNQADLQFILDQIKIAEIVELRSRVRRASERKLRG